MAVNAAGTRVYVANNGSTTVSVIDATTNAVIATLVVGLNPTGIALNPTGTRVYVANFNSGTVSVVDAATNTVIDTVSVGRAPVAFGQFIGPDARVPVAAATVFPPSRGGA